MTAPTEDQLADAKRRASAIGMMVRGRKKFSLGDGPRMEFAGLMAQIELAEAIERGQPTYMLIPCGSAGTAFMNDEQQTSFYIERHEDGEIVLEGNKYKKIGGSKTDPDTGETIQFDVLEDGSHKESRRFPKKDDDEDEDGGQLEPLISAQVRVLTRRIKALIEKGDKAAEKAEQFYKSAGIHIKEIKQKESEHWETIVREQCGLGRSRAYELMAIADGKTTLEKVRAKTNERKKVHRAKPSVPERTDTDDTRAERAEARCAARWKAFTAEEERNAVSRASPEISVDQRRAQNAALDAEIPSEAEAEESYQETLYEQACLLLADMSNETKHKFFAKIKEVMGAV